MVCHLTDKLVLGRCTVKGRDHRQFAPIAAAQRRPGVPAGFAIFPKDLSTLPREWALWAATG
jgi:hypothetical protein